MTITAHQLEFESCETLLGSGGRKFFTRRIFRRTSCQEKVGIGEKKIFYETFFKRFLAQRQAAK